MKMGIVKSRTLPDGDSMEMIEISKPIDKDGTNRFEGLAFRISFRASSFGFRIWHRTQSVPGTIARSTRNFIQA